MVDSVTTNANNNNHQLTNHHQHQQQQQHHHHHQFYSDSSSSSRRSTLPLLHQGSYHNFTPSTSSNNSDINNGINNHHNNNNNNNNNNNGGIDSSNTSSKPTSSPNLIRHSSSPAGLLSHLVSDIGYSAGSKGFDVNYNPQAGSSIGHEQHMLSRLGSQLSFTRKDHHSLSQISEMNESMVGSMSSHENERKRSVASQARPSSGFSLSAWDDSNDNNFIISTSSSNKRGKAISDDYIHSLSAMDSQQAIALEMATMERLMQVPQDSVPCKIRAKRGFATHPRSIAERERRTRISGKLKKLQELVPNMDKQTSYSDMLDLAVQHIKGLQGQIENLNHDLDSCTCGCKPNNRQP
nr:hypothetical protein [Suaeda aralocaspica]